MSARPLLDADGVVISIPEARALPAKDAAFAKTSIAAFDAAQRMQAAMRRRGARLDPTAADLRPREDVAVDENGKLPERGGETYGETRIYLDECMLDTLKVLGHINDIQWYAGCLFRKQWLSSHPRESYAGRYKAREPGGSGGGIQAARAWQMDAEAACHAAMRGMREELARALQAVAGEDESAAGRLPQLREALDHLAEFYRISRSFGRLSK